MQNEQIQNELKKYSEQINSIALFAKRINYNMDNGIDNLMELWIKDGQRFCNYVNANKSQLYLDFQKNFLTK